MHIFFSVGEPSGDLHAAKLAAELQRRVPGVVCSGFGGPLMEQAGCQILYRLTNLAVMGVLPVIPLIFKFIALARGAAKFLAAHRPDAVVLVDFPGFNWWIARAARKLGIPVFFYLPPQIWAWGPWRIKRMKKYVDHVLSGLPFEVEWYRQQGIAAEFVGHPFFDEIAEKQVDADFVESHRSPADGSVPTVAVLPGSRGREIKYNFAIQIRVMSKLRERIPNVKFLIASYKESQRVRCQELLAQLAPELPVALYVGKTSEIIQAADACLMVSGSVSLEVLARQTPAVVVYRINRLFFWFGQFLIRCQYFSLPNLIAGRPIMPEFAPIDDARKCVRVMSDLLHRLLSDRAYRAEHQAALLAICREVGAAGATSAAAAAILDKLPSPGRELHRRAA